MARCCVLLAVMLAAVGCDDGDDAAGPDGASPTPDAAEPDPDAGGPEPDMATVEPDMVVPDAEVDMAEPVVWPPVAADNAVDPDDPLAEGQHRFVYETWGVEQLDGWPPVAFLLQLMDDEPETFGDQFARFGFVRDPNGDLPFGLARGSVDPERLHNTCALCHIATLDDGRVWLGAPNAALDIEGLKVAVHDRWVAAGNAAYLTPLEREKMAFVGPGRTTAESSDYPQAVPADFPPYFQLDRRPHLNHLGTGRDVRTEAYLALYSMGLGRPDDETSAAGPFPTADVLEPFLEYLGGIEPPDDPTPPDAALVDRGAAVFADAQCTACHHPDAPEMDGVTPIDNADDGRDRLPGEDPDWPDGSIHTSALHRVLIDGDGEGGGFDEGRLALIMFIARHGLRVGPTDGYRVPTLSTLWATAPYLHNGSVPTLEALLDAPEDRPVVFEVHGVERDTTEPGNSNRGHAFGIDLSPDDKAALVAYLRSL